MFPYTLTNDSITVIHDGKTYSVRKGAANFNSLRQALLDEQWDKVPKLLTVAKSIEEWASSMGYDFTVRHGTVCYQGTALPDGLNRRITELVAKGASPVYLTRFWAKLQQNPSWRSVQQLFHFLEHEGIPIDEEGDILAYKAVKSDYTDYHTGVVSNRPGVTNRMLRNQISDDPNVGCHYGYHVGAISYANSFGDTNRRIVICRVNPQDVVCVPYDENYRKMRVCEYTVIGNYGSDLPDTVVSNEDIPSVSAPTAEVVEADEAPTTLVPHELDSKDAGELMECDLDTLRKYAAHHLHIVRASKIPGGKPALVSRIIEVRDHHEEKESHS